MLQNFFVFVTTTTLLLATPAMAQDVASVLQSAGEAMGDPDTLHSVQYSGAGWITNVGQSHTPNDDWPRFEVPEYTRSIDFENGTSTESYTRRQGDYPPLGGGAPIIGEQTRTLITSGQNSWTMNGETAISQPASAEVRQLDIWMSPHGFLKAAAAADDASAVTLQLEGRELIIVSFTAMDRFRVNGTINEDHHVERVLTWVPHPIFGDMIYDHRYTEYRVFGDFMLPTILHSHQGDPRIHPGHNSMEIRVANAVPNATVEPVAIPDNVQAATVPPVVVRSTEMADGVWRISGGTHHSVAVEFSDFVAVVEAPQNETRSLAVIAEVRQVIPDKPIRYVVNTHHHADHAGGLRTYVAQSAALITHAANEDYYNDVLLHPGTRTLEPDILSSRMPWFSSNRVPSVELVSDRHTVSDDERTMDIYSVLRLGHAGTMLIVHLPEERILINADLYSPPAPGTNPPAANDSMRSLAFNIEQLGLDVARHVGVHGLVGTHVDFLRIVRGE